MAYNDYTGADDVSPGGGSTPTAPAPTADPWSADELSAARTWAQQYYTSHQIPGSWGDVNDLINNYQAQRRTGMSHQGAMDAVPAILGWDKYAPTPTGTGGVTPPPPPAGGPPPTTSGGAGTGSGTGGAPVFTPPSYTPPPAAQAPAPFSYASFVAPDPNELNNDPFYKYTLGQEQSAIQRSAAARGVLNTGGTIADLMTNANDIASSGYQNLWNRKLGEYQTNRGNAFDNYKTNYGIGKDVYDTNYNTQYTDPFKFNYGGQQDAYNSRIHNYDLSQQYGWYGKLFDFSKDQDAWHRKMDLLPYA